MVKGDARQNSVSMNGTFQSKNAVRGSFSVRCRPSQTLLQQVYHQESKVASVRVCNVNVKY